MLLVKTYLDKSIRHGIGIFAQEYIVKDTLIWSFHPSVDRYLSEADINQLSLPCQEQIRKYSYWESTQQTLVLCGDDARFMNHSNNPNCSDTMIPGCTTAIRDIIVGEELTCDYAAFDPTDYELQMYRY